MVGTLLVRQHLPFKWNEHVLLIATEHEEAVEAILDAVESGEATVEPVIEVGDDAEALPEDTAAPERLPFETLTTFFLAGERLQKHPLDSDGLQLLLKALDVAEPTNPPYGVQRELWTRTCELADELADALTEDDEPDEETAAEVAAELHDLLRPFRMRGLGPELLRRHAGEEPGDHPLELGRLGDVRRVAGVLDDRQLRAGDLRRHVLRAVEERRILVADDHQRRHGDAGQRLDDGGVALGEDTARGVGQPGRVAVDVGAGPRRCRRAREAAARRSPSRSSRPSVSSRRGSRSCGSPARCRSAPGRRRAPGGRG